MSDQVMIERRFRGPSASANGGYAAGLLAAHVEGDPAVEVTLRVPPPLDRTLAVERGDSGARLLDGDSVIAEARPSPPAELKLPEPVSLAQAAEARRTSFLREGAAFPGCFVCGPDREGDDGLGLVFGVVDGRELVASPFEPGAELAGAGGAVRPEIVWSALDCPSGIAGAVVPGLGICVLGRIRASLLRPLELGREYVVIGWPIERDGRKLRSSSAIVDAESWEPFATSLATWIELRDQPA
ncbi:MAG: hypothetical protein M3O25_01410 [Actinomycetota bacterium]|nr:hypothetical protein [Actinomycetota bacterium]